VTGELTASQAIEEPESLALERHIGDASLVATSRIALVEVPRATAIANPAPEVREEAARLLAAAAERGLAVSSPGERPTFRV
jgi:hypothetical protein